MKLNEKGLKSFADQMLDIAIGQMKRKSNGIETLLCAKLNLSLTTLKIVLC